MSQIGFSTLMSRSRFLFWIRNVITWKLLSIAGSYFLIKQFIFLNLENRNKWVLLNTFPSKTNENSGSSRNEISQINTLDVISFPRLCRLCRYPLQNSLGLNCFCIHGRLSHGRSPKSEYDCNFRDDWRQYNIQTSVHRARF